VQKQESPIVGAAEAVSQGICHHELTETEKKVAGPVVHDAMGALSGAVYGTLSELQPVMAAGAGLPFGATVWLLADEAALLPLSVRVPECMGGGSQSGRMRKKSDSEHRLRCRIPPGRAAQAPEFAYCMLSEAGDGD
jgi:hypothetical protein